MNEHKFVLTFFCVLIASAPLFAQQDPPTEITADDFSRTRNITSSINAGDSASSSIKAGDTAFVFRKPKYRLKRVVPRPKRLGVPAKGPKGSKKPGSTAAVSWERIGVTVWRLGEEKAVDDAQPATRMLVLEGSSEKSYIPKRAAAETIFAGGDKVRLSIEAPRSGYLYVIDREILDGDKLGDAVLIFPSMMSRGGNNQTQPGMMIDIPDQSDRPPFFTLKSNNPAWRGELLTIIHSPTPLKDLGVPEKTSQVNSTWLHDMEKKYLQDVAEYDQPSTAGTAYSPNEKQAGGATSRQLTLEDPFPQTMYRVKLNAKDPLVINLSILVK